MDDYYLNLQLCGTVVNVITGLSNLGMLRVNPLKENVSLLLPSSSSISHKKNFFLNVLKCAYNEFEYNLIRHPKRGNMLFVIHEKQIKLLVLSRYLHNSYEW